MQFSVLGPLEVRRTDEASGEGDAAIVIGVPKVRTLLIALVLDAGRVVPATRLVENIWEEQPPAQPLVSLRSYVSNLRRLVPGGSGTPLIVTRGRGYLLDVDPGQIDATRFEALAAEGRQLLAAGDAVRAVERLDEALALWRGPALCDVDELAFAQAPIARLEGLRLNSVEDRLDALLAAGRHTEVVAEAAGHVTAHPLRERPRLQLMLALHRAGRSPEALAVHRDFRALLADELGLDPSPAIERLAAQVLRQDPDLTAAPPAGSDPSVAPPRRVDLRRPPATTAAPSRDVTLVGRDAERARIGAALERLAGGCGGVILLAGEAGIGKTTLLEDLSSRAEAAGVPVVWGRCLETQSAPAFWPWTQVLRSLADRHDDEMLTTLVAGHAAAVGQLVPEIAARTGRRHEVPGADPHTARFALHDAVTSFLGRAAAPSGLVVVIDDLHWGDGASCELAALLGGQAARARILLAVSHRDTSADRTPSLEQALADLVRGTDVAALTLGGLSPAEVDVLVRDVAETTDEGVRRVRDRAGGNPFFVRQLAQLLAESDGTSETARAIPVGVRQVIVRRLARLPTEVRRTLDVAALLGQDIEPGVVGRCRGRELVGVLDDLDAAIAHGLVEAGSGRATGYRFSHALVRDTLELEVPTGQAVQLHVTAADVLETLPAPPVQAVADHLWHAAELVPPERGVRWLRQAAEQSAAVFAYEQAEELLRRALHLLARRGGTQTAALEMVVRLRLIQVLTGLHGWTHRSIEEVAGPVRALADRVGLSAETTPLWWSLWTLYTTRGDSQVSRRLAHQLLEQVTSAHVPDQLIAGHVAVAYTELFRGTDHDVVMDHLDRAAAAERLADPERLAMVPEHLSVALRITRTMAHALHGDAAAALAAAEDAVAVADGLGQPFRQAYARLFGTFGAAVLDLPEETRRHGVAGLEICDRAGLPYLAHLITASHSWSCVRLGEPVEPHLHASASSDAALDGAGFRHALPHGRLLHAEIRALAGDLVGARETLAAAAAVAEHTGELVYGRQFARVRARAGGRR